MPIKVEGAGYAEQIYVPASVPVQLSSAAVECVGLGSPCVLYPLRLLPGGQGPQAGLHGNWLPGSSSWLPVGGRQVSQHSRSPPGVCCGPEVPARRARTQCTFRWGSHHPRVWQKRKRTLRCCWVKIREQSLNNSRTLLNASSVTNFRIHLISYLYCNFQIINQD